LFEDYCFSIAEIDFGQNWFSAKKTVIKNLKYRRNKKLFRISISLEEQKYNEFILAQNADSCILNNNECKKLLLVHTLHYFFVSKRKKGFHQIWSFRFFSHLRGQSAVNNEVCCRIFLITFSIDSMT
jgi:hypothetical protein